METKDLNKRIGLILTGLGIANIGEWIYHIALNLLILGIHGTAWSVGMLYVIRPIARTLANGMSTPFIDKLNKRRWLLWLDFIRGILVASLLMSTNLWFIYGVVFLMEMANTMHYPLKVSYDALAVPSQRQKKFNAWQSLVDSGGFLLGPLIAGYLLTVGTPHFATLIYAGSLAVSGIIKVLLLDLTVKMVERVSFWEESKTALGYLKRFCKERRSDVMFYLAVSLLFIWVAGSTSLEAAFSLGVLLMTEAEYGLLLSISGAGYLVGAALNSRVVERLTIRKLVMGGATLTSLGWLLFSLAPNYVTAATGFFIVSFGLPFLNTGINTYVQTRFPKDKIGQLTTGFSLVTSLLTVLTVSAINGVSLFADLRVVLIAVSAFKGVTLLLIWVSSKQVEDLTTERSF